jgi:hypothetical protein
MPNEFVMKRCHWMDSMNCAVDQGYNVN